MGEMERHGVWAGRFERLAERLGPRVGRRDLRGRAEGYLRGLLGRVERKNSWQLARPWGTRLPTASSVSWGEPAGTPTRFVTTSVAMSSIEYLGQPDGVWIVDETGFLKKVAKSAGVARQDSGTAGRIENSQIGVFLAYRSARGVAFVDRALYLPKAWADDRPCRRVAGIPEEVAFATKPEMARAMPRRAFKAGVPARWVTADEVHGGDYSFAA